MHSVKILLDIFRMIFYTGFPNLAISRILSDIMKLRSVLTMYHTIIFVAKIATHGTKFFVQRYFLR